MADELDNKEPEFEEVNIDDQLSSDLLEDLRNLEAEASAVDGEVLSSSVEGQSAEPDIQTSELLQGLLSPAFDILAPNWDVQDNEKIALSTALGGVVDKYFPDGAHNEFGVEISAAIIVMTVFGSRLGTPRKIEKEVDNKPPDKTPVHQKKAENDFIPESGAELGAT